LETVHGYASESLSSHVADVFLLPGGFYDVSGTGTYNATAILADTFCYSGAIPEAYDGRVFWVKDGDDNKHIMLDTHFDRSGSKVTDYSGFVMLDERKTFSYSASVSVTATKTLSITGYTALGLCASNDYYNGWRIEWTSGATTKYATVTDYAVVVADAAFTTLEDIDAMGWDTATTGDSFTIRRWFHGQTNFVPSFGTIPGQPFASEGVVRGCGGAAATTGYDPWWVGYVDRTYFNNVDSGAGVVVKGTYADLMEVSVDSGVTMDGATRETASSDESLEAAVYDITFSLEYDGYQESELSIITEELNAVVAPQYLSTKFTVQFAKMSKRVTAINFYAREKLLGIVGQFYFIRRIPLYLLTIAQDDEWTFVSDATSGRYVLDGTGVGNAHAQAQIKLADWTSKGASYYDRTGRVERDVVSGVATDLRSIVSWKYTEEVAGRRFFAYYYDPNTSETVTSWIRFTPFSQGVPSHDIIPWDRLSYEFQSTGGDPDPIVGLKADRGFLYTFKDKSIRSSYINETPETWVHSDLSGRDGTAGYRSLLSVPESGLVFADVDHLKMIFNQRIVTLTDFIKNTYLAIDDKGLIVCWYDKIDGAICFTDGITPTHYRGYKSKSGYAWYKVVVGTNQYPEFIGVERDGSILFTNNHTSGFQGYFKWGRGVYLFGGGTIIPYLKTNNVIVDEQAHVLLDKIVLTKSGNADAGTLQNTVYVDTVASSQPFTDEDKTAETLYEKFRSTTPRQGRRIQVEYNYHATGESLSTGKLELHGIDIYGEVVQPPEKSV
jgi:hypothetical protein